MSHSRPEKCCECGDNFLPGQDDSGKLVSCVLTCRQKSEGTNVTYVTLVETYHVDVLDVVDHAVVVRFKLSNV